MSYLDIRYKNNKKVHYDDVFSDFLVSKIFEANLGRKPETLTEVGVGTGKLAEKFIQRHDIKVRGVDIERYPHLHKAVEFHKASVEQIGSVAIQQSDVFFSKSVIEHVDKFTDFFEAAKYCIHDRGIIVVLCPNWRTQWSNFYDDPTHLRPFNDIGLKTAAEMCDLKVVSCAEFYQLPVIWKYPLIGKFLQSTRLRLPSTIRNRLPILRFSYENMLLLVARKSKYV